MPQVVIENPILNSPYKEPSKHFKFSDDGITDEIVESRRISSYFVPIAQPKKKAGAKQLTLESEWTQDRVKENDFINRIRTQVATWRKGNYVGITNVSRQLLEYWKNPDRERKLFFCQILQLGSRHSTTELLPQVSLDCMTKSREIANPSVLNLSPF